MKTLEKSISYCHDQQQRFIADLIEFSAIPSVSTNPERQTEMIRAAKWVENRFNALGLEDVGIHETGGHPLVFGQATQAGAAAPTVLVYGHYDVQPADPLDEWESDPFQPEIRGENLYGRGVSDMKGQVAACINAVESILKFGDLPVNLKFLIEGEEEIGSPNLAAFIENHKTLLACDVALNTDTGMIAPDLPTITYALRGLACFEIVLRGPKQDLHSGMFGGTIHNPGQAIAELIAGMHTPQGQITLPGFYDSVIELSATERAELSHLPKDAAWYLENSGVPTLWGEPEYTPDERVGGRPTLEVNGLYSGYIGEGGKTVLPAYAMAKLSCRLVPNQDPNEVYQQFLAYCKKQIPESIQWEITRFSGALPSMSDRNSPWIQAFAKAAETVWGVRPVYKREGGSVPVVADFQTILGVESINTGFGLPTDNVHGPNEKLHLPTWHNGIAALIHFFFNLRAS